MTERPISEFEQRVRRLAAHYPYPPTPDLSAEWGQPVSRHPASLGWLRLAAAGLLLALIVMAAVPAARATVAEVLQWGAVRLQFGPPTTAPDADSVISDLAEIDFGAPATLELVRQLWGAEYRLPRDLPAPNRVLLQEEGSTAVGVISLWLDESDRLEWALFQLGSNALYEKAQPTVVEQVQVAGHPALWTSGPYLVQTESGGLELRRLMAGHVLIWTDGPFTYRLESEKSLSQALAVARSLYE